MTSGSTKSIRALGYQGKRDWLAFIKNKTTFAFVFAICTLLIDNIHAQHRNAEPEEGRISNSTCATTTECWETDINLICRLVTWRSSSMTCWYHHHEDHHHLFHIYPEEGFAAAGTSPGGMEFKFLLTGNLTDYDNIKTTRWNERALECQAIITSIYGNQDDDDQWWWYIDLNWGDGFTRCTCPWTALDSPIHPRLRLKNLNIHGWSFFL